MELSFCMSRISHTYFPTRLPREQLQCVEVKYYMNEYSDCAQKERNKAHGNQIGSLDLDVASNGQCFIFRNYRYANRRVSVQAFNLANANHGLCAIDIQHPVGAFHC
jgi:hypothetical protein